MENEEKLEEIYKSYIKKEKGMSLRHFNSFSKEYNLLDKKCTKEKINIIFSKLKLSNMLDFDLFKMALKEISLIKKISYNELKNKIVNKTQIFKLKTFNEDEEILRMKMEKELKIKEKREIIKKEIFEKNENLRKNEEINKTKTNEEKIKEILEDMSNLGTIMKEEILEEKKKNPENFIPIEEATKNENQDDIIKCLGILAKNLENIGIVTAIEKNPNPEDENNNSDTIIQFIMNGMIEKKKFDLHFDLGEKRNSELLNDKNKQEKFNQKLRKKLSLEFNIPENKIILMNPQKGSYRIQVLFQTEDFNNDNINLDMLKQSCKNDNEFKELSYLKEIQESLLMEGCKLNRNMLDSKGNRESGWAVGEKRGGKEYFPPQGWKGFGLKVLNKYDNGNNDWLDCHGNKNEWAVAYHGLGTKLGFTLEKAANNIIHGGFKAGSGQYYENYDNDNKPGEKIGVGVYCTPKPDVMEYYAKQAKSKTIINGKQFIIGFMMRVKPDKIRYTNFKKEYWVLNGSIDEMRPYRLLIKEFN